MKKVAIIGCGGSGKSHVARTLGNLLQAPVTHLDAVFYDSDWNELPMAEFEARQHELVAEPSWVIDGNYNSTLPVRLHACDTVVFLDLPAVTCLWGALSRQVRHGAGQNQTSGVYNRMHWGVIRYIRTYRAKMRPKVLRKIEEHADHATVVTLTSRRQVRRWLTQVATDQARP
ncbi:MAG TPA: topology modulation protein [Actinomycetes bacterium]|nr:topology modulation protein [Actinomycetes bacterium]